MYKSLKIVVPTIQVLIVLAAFALPEFYHNPRFYEYHLNDIRGFQNVVMGLNFPLAALWLVVFSPVTWLSTYFPSLNGTPPLSVLIPVVILLASSGALFWYFVVAEIEMRARGRSMLRFSGWLKEGVILVILFSFGVGSVTYGYMESWPLRYARPVDSVLVGLFPALWAAAFIGAALHDLIVGITAHGHSLDTRVK